MPGLPALRAAGACGPRDGGAARPRAGTSSCPAPVGARRGLRQGRPGRRRPRRRCGFGAVEVGTVTAQAQPGNARPRLARLPADRALVNRLGFNNAGRAAAAARLARRRRRGPRVDVVVGVNLGRTKAVADAGRGRGLRRAARACAGAARRLRRRQRQLARTRRACATCRPSPRCGRCSPRCAGARRGGRGAPRAAAREDRARPRRRRRRRGRRPRARARARRHRRDEHDDRPRRAWPATPAAVVAPPARAGCRAPPLAPRALAVLRRLRARTGGRLVLVAAGGIETPDDAWARLRGRRDVRAGRTPGFVHGGPRWPVGHAPGARGAGPRATAFADRRRGDRDGRLTSDGPPPGDGVRPARRAGRREADRPCRRDSRRPAAAPRPNEPRKERVSGPATPGTDPTRCLGKRPANRARTLDQGEEPSTSDRGGGEFGPRRLLRRAIRV